MARSIPLPPNRIRELREDRGWSEAKLGARCIPPFTATQIDKREKGQTAVTIQDMERIARALECATWDLLPLPPLSPEETAVVNLYRGLSEPDRQAAYRVIDAMAKSNDGDLEDGRTNG